MSDLSNHVYIPKENFAELEAAAYVNHHVPDTRERVAQTLQTAGIFGIMTAAVIGGTWGWAAGVDWLEKRRQKRWNAKYDRHQKNPTQS